MESYTGATRDRVERAHRRFRDTQPSQIVISGGRLALPSEGKGHTSNRYWQLGNLWSFSVVRPFIASSVQNNKADLVATLAGNPDDVVGAEPLSKGNKFMIDRRLVLGMIAAATMIDASRIAFAKEKHHLNGKGLLGENIKKNGKHKIHTTGKKVDVFAEVNNGKVTAVTAAGMQVKKVKSRQKLAETTPGITLASMQLAQADFYYYGYWVYDDLTDTYIWFPADYVIVDSSWFEYTA
jgi:hypothetical protein